MIEGQALTQEQETVLRETLAALRTIRHGSVHLIIQDGRVVQIETVEKLRVPQKIPCM
ncbi:MAG: DUF2292 domain-containing protein [Chloroflexota bacterium]|nr:MAG: DUF2292 domain-containing protein [Chloroflexota bacterium]